MLTVSSQFILPRVQASLNQRIRPKHTMLTVFLTRFHLILTAM